MRNLKNQWRSMRAEIDKRLMEFKDIGRNSDNRGIFKELAFCLFTPQSKAKHCWEAVGKLDKKGLIHQDDPSRIAAEINKVRFRNNKARYLIKARKQFFSKGAPGIKSFIRSFSSPFEAREWLVKNITGMGYKEAGHFLRNIGLGGELAILDRHILKNMKLLGVIKDIPKTLTPKKYIELEQDLTKFSKKTGIPMDHIDLLFWSKETGEIFK